MSRSSINNYLGRQLEKMMNYPSIDEKPFIYVRVQKTQEQEFTWCGYFACAFATSLCMGIDIESITFDTNKMLTHWLECIKAKKISMFPYCLKRHDDNDDHEILEYERVIRN